MNDNLLGTLHHTGIAVNDLDEAKKQYQILGYNEKHEDALVDLKRKIRVIFMEKEDDIIELISPLSFEEASPVDRYLNLRMGYVIYHRAYNVSNIEDAIMYLKEHKFIQIENISVSDLIDGRREVYMYSRKVGLVELLEDK